MPLVATSSSSSSVITSTKTCLICYRDVPIKNHNNNNINAPTRTSIKTGSKSQRKRDKLYRRNVRLCQRFGALASRYLELPLNHFKPEQTLQLRAHLQQSQLAPKSINNNNNSEMDDQSNSNQVCDHCLPMVESFCQIYHEWQSLQLQLNWRLEKISEIMTKNKNRYLNLGIRIGEIEAVKFRKSYVEKVDQRKRKAVPKVFLRNFSITEIEQESESGSESDFTDLFTPIVTKKSKPTVEVNDDDLDDLFIPIVTKHKRPIAGAPVDEAGQSQPPTQAGTELKEDDNESIRSSLKDSKVHKKVKEWINKVSTVRPSPPPYETPRVDKTEKPAKSRKWTPLTCESCKKEFRYSRTFRDHQKKVHKASLEHSSDAPVVTGTGVIQVEFKAAEEEGQTQQRPNQMNTDVETDSSTVVEEETVESVREQTQIWHVREREQIEGEPGEEEGEMTHQMTSSDDNHPPQLSEEQETNHPCLQ